MILLLFGLSPLLSLEAFWLIVFSLFILFNPSSEAIRIWNNILVTSSLKLSNNSSNKEKFILCRGHLKNDDFSEAFDSNNIDLKELVVYKNLSNSKTINEAFDSIMFYSPSGIKSFLENNNINDSNCICIGKTTAKFAAMHSSKVLFCQTPTIKNVIEKTIKLYDA